MNKVCLSRALFPGKLPVQSNTQLKIPTNTSKKNKIKMFDKRGLIPDESFLTSKPFCQIGRLNFSLCSFLLTVFLPTNTFRGLWYTISFLFSLRGFSNFILVHRVPTWPLLFFVVINYERKIILSICRLSSESANSEYTCSRFFQPKKFLWTCRTQFWQPCQKSSAQSPKNVW